jgi:hypothetical protein
MLIDVIIVLPNIDVELVAFDKCALIWGVIHEG